MDKGLTDEEIIKALECCASQSIQCDECSLQNVNSSICTSILSKNALNLINRQKAEIEELKKQKEELRKLIERIG